MVTDMPLGNGCVCLSSCSGNYNYIKEHLKWHKQQQKRRATLALHGGEHCKYYT